MRKKGIASSYQLTIKLALFVSVYKACILFYPQSWKKNVCLKYLLYFHMMTGRRKTILETCSFCSHWLCQRWLFWRSVSGDHSWQQKYYNLCFGALVNLFFDTLACNHVCIIWVYLSALRYLWKRFISWHLITNWP